MLETERDVLKGAAARLLNLGRAALITMFLVFLLIAVLTIVSELLSIRAERELKEFIEPLNRAVETTGAMIAAGAHGEELQTVALEARQKAAEAGRAGGLTRLSEMGGEFATAVLALAADGNERDAAQASRSWSRLREAVKGEEARLEKDLRLIQNSQSLFVLVLGLVGLFAGANVLSLWSRNSSLEAVTEVQREHLRAVLDSSRAQGRELESATSFLRTVLNNLEVGIAVTQGPQHRIAVANPAFCRGLGRNQPELLGQSLLELWKGLDGSQLFSVLNGVLESGVPRQFEDWEYVQGAKKAYWSGRVQPLGGEGLVVMVEDTTRRVQAREAVQQALRAAQGNAAQLQAVFDSMTEAVFIIDLQGRVTDMNHAALRLVRIAGKEEALIPLRKHLRRLEAHFPDGSPVTLAALPAASVLRGEPFRDLEINVRQPGGQELHLNVSAAPVRGPDGGTTMLVGVVRDVTELKELDRAKDEFLAVASHELRTPLTSVIGFTQLLARRMDRRLAHPPPHPCADGCRQDRDILETVLEQGRRLNRLTADLLDVSRLDTGRLELHLEHVDLAELAEEVIGRLALFTRGHRITLSAGACPADGGADSAGCQVLGDRSRLDQILTNLIQNAIAYSPEDTEITVTLSRQGAEVELAVWDNGMGIPVEHLAHIFDRFYRAGQSAVHGRRGMGLGLYISRQIAERHGGRLGAESTLGEGSVFRLKLPALDA